MIANIFKKSSPINYALVLLFAIFSFFIYAYKHNFQDVTGLGYAKNAFLFFIILGSLFLTNFIIKKNGLCKDSTYTVYICFLLFLIFPSILINLNLLLANLFVLLAMRRIVSMQTLKLPKEKIFDASLWIFLAAMLNYWCVLFIILVYISIILHVSRDYKNWILPIIAFITATVLFFFFAFLINENWITLLIKNAEVNTRIDYFNKTSENISFSIYATIVLFFMVGFYGILSKKAMILQASYRKIIFWFLIGVVIFILSPVKSNDVLLFTIAPIAMLATVYLESMKNNFQKEMALYILTFLSLVCFWLQL